MRANKQFFMRRTANTDYRDHLDEMVKNLCSEDAQ